MIRTHAVSTPEPCQSLTAAAIRDAWHRRDIRVILKDISRLPALHFLRFKIAIANTAD